MKNNERNKQSKKGSVPKTHRKIQHGGIEIDAPERIRSGQKFEVQVTLHYEKLPLSDHPNSHYAVYVTPTSCSASTRSGYDTRENKKAVKKFSFTLTPQNPGIEIIQIEVYCGPELLARDLLEYQVEKEALQEQFVHAA